jgi:SAM-dependent methyltransferase
MGILSQEHDAFGKALLDHLHEREGEPLMLEGDDDSVRLADLQPKDFFLPVESWPWWEQRLIEVAKGRVLDLGAGAGRHSLHLQGRGHAVTAVDLSPGAVEVCRARGIREVQLADLTEAPNEGSWDTILLMGGNLGLAGDWGPTRALLACLATLTPPGGVLIGDSVDPTSEDPADVEYEDRNRRAGFHRGRVRLRLRYRGLVTPWWDQLNIPPAEIEDLVSGTGWALEQTLIGEDGYGVVLRRQGPS